MSAFAGKVPIRWIIAALVASAALLLANSQASAASSDTNARSGAITPRVVGGTNAPVGTWPSITALFTGIATDTLSDDTLCGGTLIAPRWVLTAAHCVYSAGGSVYSPSNLGFLVGGVKLNPSDGEQRIGSAVVPHPAYNALSYSNDLALVRLNSPSGKPVRLIGSPSEAASWEAGDTAKVAGWGLTNPSDPESISNDLKQATLGIKSAAECSAAFPGVDNGKILCALGDSAEDACGGDSGGPLEVEVNGARRLVGAVAFGPLDCGAAPGAYTRVTPYRDWIGSYVADELQAPGTVSFGSRKAKGKKRRSVTLTVSFKNLVTSRLSAAPASYSLTGAGSTSFTRLNGCPSSLAYGATCSINVTFKPKGKGTKSATLKITSSRGATLKQVQLTGKGI